MADFHSWAKDNLAKLAEDLHADNQRKDEEIAQLRKDIKLVLKSNRELLMQLDNKEQPPRG